jgi:repressor LexA
VKRNLERLSERQKNILRYMRQYIDQHGFPPTIREIGVATNINSTSVVNYNLDKLVTMGWLERSERVSRGLRLVDREMPCGGNAGGRNGRGGVKAVRSGLHVPIVGQIVASEPVPTPEDATISEYDRLEVTPDMIKGLDPDQVFALRVKGDSMVDALIGDGDIVIMRHYNNELVRDGDMVAVRLLDRNETTLKMFYKEGERIRLQPKNPTMGPIYVHSSNVMVQGLFIGLLR